MLTLEVFNKTKTRIIEKTFRSLLLKAEKVLKNARVIPNGRKNFHVELTFVSEAAIKELNGFYRRKNKPTDVISLSYLENAMSDPFVGEIFICVPFARKQAKELGNTFYEELGFLFVHGLLHVFGYDHKTPSESKRMQGLTEKIVI